MFSNKLAIIWRLLGDSGDYLAILEVIAVLLGHEWVIHSVNLVVEFLFRPGS